MPEVHFLGTIKGACGFGQAKGLSLRWRITADPATWAVMDGSCEGKTQVDASMGSRSGWVWDHPLDVYFAVTGVEIWPRMQLEVWGHDDHGRQEIVGYGMCHLPTCAGQHALEAVTWLPRGSLTERFHAWFLGGHPRLRETVTVTGEADRFELSTTTRGVVRLVFEVMLLGLSEGGVQTEAG